MLTIWHPDMTEYLSCVSILITYSWAQAWAGVINESTHEYLIHFLYGGTVNLKATICCLRSNGWLFCLISNQIEQQILKVQTFYSSYSLSVTCSSLSSCLSKFGRFTVFVQLTDTSDLMFIRFHLTEIAKLTLSIIDLVAPFVFHVITHIISIC